MMKVGGRNKRRGDDRQQGQNWIRRVERRWRWSSKWEADRSCVWSLIRKMVVRGGTG